MAGTTVADLRRQIEAAKARVTDPVAFSRLHADIARKALADVQARQGVKPTITIVDGRRGASEDSVRPFGVIRYDISPMGEIVDAVWEELVKRSPIGPGKDGHYRDAHWLFVNKERIDVQEGGSPLAIPADAEIIILNIKPYARKIEKGYRRFAQPGRRRATRYDPGVYVQAPNGVYELTAQAMARRFGNMVNISFTYQAAMAFGLIEGPGENRSDLRYPAIQIWPR